MKAFKNPINAVVDVSLRSQQHTNQNPDQIMCHASLQHGWRWLSSGKLIAFDLVNVRLFTQRGYFGLNGEGSGNPTRVIDLKGRFPALLEDALVTANLVWVTGNDPALQG